jgi:hypothetical protein
MDNIDMMIAGWLLPDKSKYGYSKNAQWKCEDNYLVLYSTGALYDSINGEHDGKYACAVYKPNSRKKPTEWKMVYWRTFSKRKLARKYAEKYYYKHSPKRAAKHGVL